jgi:gliding motility-associated-like protein
MKKRLHAIFVLINLACTFIPAKGQGLCDVGGGGFDLIPAAGCAPLTVKINNKVSGTSLSYAQQYDGITENPTLTRNATEFTYPAAGTYKVLQSVNVGGLEVYHCKEVKVYESRSINFLYTSCGGGKVKLLIVDDIISQAYDKVEINWGDASPKSIWFKGDPLEVEHNYASTTESPAILAKGVYTSNTACQEGTEYPVKVVFQQPLLKNIQLKTVEMKGNGSLEVTYEGVTSIVTDILTSSDDGKNFIVGGTRTSGGTQFYRIPDLNAAMVYEIKLASKDLCGGQQDSEVATSMTLKGVSSDEKNLISWNEYPDHADFQEYQLMRDGVLLKSFSDIKTTSYEDNDVQCGDNFEYFLVAVTKTIQSTSAPLIVKTAMSSPRTIDQAYVTVNSNDLIQLTAVLPGSGSKTNYELVIQRAEGAGGTFKKINTLYSETSFQDFDVQADKNSYCYRFIYQNSFGQKSPVSEPICSILLENKSSIFSWTTVRPFTDEIQSFRMIQMGSLGSKTERDVKLQNTFIPALTGQSDPQYTFQIRADSKNANFQSFSNAITYKRDADIFVPTAFSPNEDGTNDMFEVKASMFKSFNISILNRWGEVIFHSNDIAKGWDGMFKGKVAPTGSYVFNIEIVNNINQTVKKNGTFVLLK